MTTASRNYYDVLGVGEDADRDEIRKAYRKLAKEFHPDANPGDESAAERFKELGEAYAVLSNEEKRRQYDQMRKAEAFGFGPRGTGFRPGPRGTRGQPGGAGDVGGFSFEDLGDLGGLGDLFSTIFDRGRRGQAGGGGAPPRSRGQDVEAEVDVSFATAVRGGTVTVSVPVTEECAVCGGEGAQPGTSVRRCQECGGTGTVSFGQGGFAVTRPCPACIGRGAIPDVPCAACRGQGMVRQVRKLQVKVPPGVDTGSRLRVAGQGQSGGRGGKPGDLLLAFRVKPHHFFRRDGLDIHCTVPLNLAQAVLGTRIKVKAVDGTKVLLRIPPGTQSGTRFRVPGKGVAKGGRRGDQYVEVRVEVPTTLSEEEREHFVSFAEAAGLPH